MKLIATLTNKSQITLPRQVRRALDLVAGDKVRFSIEQRQVTLFASKPPALGVSNARRTVWAPMQDWNTPEDDAAFADI